FFLQGSCSHVFPYYLNEQGDWVYKPKKFDPMGQQSCSAHPYCDKYSWHRSTIKKCFSRARWLTPVIPVR
uniref:Nucleolar protein 10 n=1 Tax=Theropithecus gelada TaxID=9565 RepID=A0A8D2GC26_THEGE